MFIAIAGFTTLLDGFSSTNIYSCQRRMDYSKVTILELSNEVVGLIVTLTWAYFYPSAWALLGGAVVSRIYIVAASHFLIPGISNRFHWDPVAFRELLHFGKWIFFSSAVYLIYAQGDRILLGKYLDAATLGVYSIAIMLSESVSNVVNKLNTSVLYPALSRVVNNEPHRLQAVFYRTRLGTDALMVVPIAVLLVIGEQLVHLLYDSRYFEAGWMLQILSFRLLMTAMLTGGASCLLVLGHSKYSVIQNLFRATWILLGIPIVWPIYGVEGVVWVVGLTEIPVFFVVWFGMAKYGILSIRHELRTFIFVAAGLLIGFALLQLPIGRS